MINIWLFSLQFSWFKVQLSCRKKHLILLIINLLSSHFGSLASGTRPAVIDLSYLAFICSGVYYPRVSMCVFVLVFVCPCVIGGDNSHPVCRSQCLPVEHFQQRRADQAGGLQCTTFTQSHALC